MAVNLELARKAGFLIYSLQEKVKERKEERASGLTNRNCMKPEEKYSTCASRGEKKERPMFPAEGLHGKPLADFYPGILNMS